MTRDEPFILGRNTLVLTDNLQKIINHEIGVVRLLHQQMKKQTVHLRLVEKPSEIPLKVGEDWNWERKISYILARRANAEQLYDAREALFENFFEVTLASCINIQRLLESYDFDPPRNWMFYPVVDSATGMGVPRAMADQPMLNLAQVVVDVPYRGLFVYDSNTRLFTELLQGTSNND